MSILHQNTSLCSMHLFAFEFQWYCDAENNYCTKAFGNSQVSL